MIVMDTYAENINEYEEIIASFNSQPKCRYKEVIKDIEDININDCESIITIEGNHIKIQQLGFNHEDCTGGEGTFIHQKNALSIGSTIYGIANRDTYKVIYGGKSYFDRYTEIPLCGEKVVSFPEKLGLGVGSIVVLSILIFIVKKYISRKYKHKK